MKLTDEQIKAILLEENGSVADYNKVLESILNAKRISNNLFHFILNHNDTIEKMECLFACQYFTKTQFKELKQFIKRNLNHEEECFVNELIEFAIFWDFDDFWDECIQFIENPKVSDLIIVMAIEYVFYRMNNEKLPEAVEAFQKVIDSAEYYQNCQTVASLYLFRLTHNKEYYDYLKESMDLDSNNRIVLRNTLAAECNQQKYFAYHDEMYEWVNDAEK